MLTKEQQENLDQILNTFNNLYPKKYKQGAREHGGHLGDLPSIDLAYNLLEEAMDQVAYAVTLIEKLKFAEE